VSVTPGQVMRPCATSPARASACSACCTRVRSRPESARRSEEKRRHPPVGVLGPEQRLEQRDLVGREHHVRRHLDADRLALRAGDQRTLRFTARSMSAADAARRSAFTSSASCSTVAARSGVLHDRRGHPPARRRRARRSPARGMRAAGATASSDDGREHAPSLGMRPAATSPRRAPGRACRRRSRPKRLRGTAGAWSSARSGGRRSAA
jgi:hypothetical protein